MEQKKQEFRYSERTLKNERFDRRLIEHIVQLAQQGVPRKELVKTYGMHRETLDRWIAKPNFSPCKRRSYTTAEKRSVVRAVNAGMAITEAVIVFNIPTSTMIRRWISGFSEQNMEISSPKPTEMPKKSAPEFPNPDVEALTKALNEANMKIKALDTLIDIAEEKLKIDIRKKSGARQSSK